MAKKTKKTKADSPAKTEATDNRGANQKRKYLTGLVVSSKMQKTAVVRVDNRIKHPFYKKYVVRSKRFKAHDEHNKAKEGDLVSIVSSKPISKEKRWVIASILRTGNEAALAKVEAASKGAS